MIINLKVLEVAYNFGGKTDTLYPVILSNDREKILVDCGYAGFMPLIEKAAGLQGFSLQDLTGVIITHHDIDHVGGLFEMKEKFPWVKIYSSAIEASYISGKVKSLRLQQAEDLFSTIPENQKEGALQFQEMLKSVKAVPVDAVFSEHNYNSFFDGLQILSTPGHTPGHISIYLKESKTLIAADAVVIENGEFEIANPQYTLDLKQAIDSVKKISTYKIDQVICYHGGTMTGAIANKLNKLISKYSFFV